MKLISILLLCSIGFAGLVQQPNVEDVFTEEELKAAQTCKGITFMNEEETAVILMMNLARLYPQKFRDQVAIPYAKFKKMNSGKYYQSLLRDLAKASPAKALQPDLVLYKEAKAHAHYTGEKGKTGHDGPRGKSFDTRMKGQLKSFHGVGENCQYGFIDALDIVMDLLIDEGIQGYGHRKNILNPDFSHAGVSIAPHKNYTYNCVTDFGSR